MLEKFLGLKIKGRCFEQETELEFFPGETQRVSLVFGRNGSGKSTVSRAFVRLAENGGLPDGMEMVEPMTRPSADPKKKIAALVDKENKPLTRVFNEDYVREKVDLKDDVEGLGTIVNLGEPKAYDDKIKTLVKERDKIYSSININQADIAELEYEADANSLPALRKRIKSTLRNDETESGWAYRQAEIAGNGASPSEVDDETIKTIVETPNATGMKITLGEFNKRVREKEKKISQLEEKYPPLKVGDVDVDTLAENVFQTWERVSRASEGGLKAQDELQREFFELKENVSRFLAVRWTDCVPADARAVNRVMGCLMGISRYLDELTPIVPMYAVFGREINIPPHTHKRLTHLMNALKEAFETLSEKRKRYGIEQEAAKITTELITFNNQLAKKEIAKDYNAVKRMEGAYKKIEDELQKYEKEYAAIEEEIEKQKEIARKDTTIAAKRINAALRYIFLSDKRIQLKAEGDAYRVLTHGRNVKPHDISVGERNVLALCYFFADMFNNADAKSFYKDERLVVLDDPVSSFDHENKMGVLSYIMFEIGELLAGDPNTRVICLMHELYSFMALATSIHAHDKNVPKERKFLQVLLALDCKKKNALEDKFESVDNINEYRRNFLEIFAYAKQDEKKLKEDIHVGNQTRRMLEAFSTFVYRKGFEYLFLGDVIPGTDDDAKKYRKHFENVFTRFIVNDESHHQGRIRSLGDANNLFPFIDEGERQRAVRGAICLVYLILPQHVLSLFDGDAENNEKMIQLWLKDIRDSTPLTDGE